MKTTDGSLPSNHYRVRVDRRRRIQRAPRSYFNRLTYESVYCELDVSFLFEERHAHEWKQHLSRNGWWCGAADEEIVLYVHDFGEDVPQEKAIEWGLQNGYLPADHVECLAVGEDRELYSIWDERRLIAPGSSIESCEGVQVATLYRASGQRYCTIGFAGGSEDRYLFVKKPSG